MIKVTRGPWYSVCPVCGANWQNGELWIARGGPPCPHLKIYMRGRADGSYVQWMKVDYFPGLRAVARALGRFLLFPFYAVYFTWQARRARRDRL
jgi:hypothetical protein